MRFREAVFTNTQNYRAMRIAGLATFGLAAAAGLILYPLDHGGNPPTFPFLPFLQKIPYPSFLLGHSFPAPFEFRVDDALTTLGEVGLLTSFRKKGSLAEFGASALLGLSLFELIQINQDPGDIAAYAIGSTLGVAGLSVIKSQIK